MHDNIRSVSGYNKKKNYSIGKTQNSDRFLDNDDDEDEGQGKKVLILNNVISIVCANPVCANLISSVIFLHRLWL